MGDDAFYDLYDKTWYSIDAYNVCSPKTYDEFGFDYQQALISKVGGGLFHTHGTGIFHLLPKLAKLKDIGVIQVGRDLAYGSEKTIGTEHFEWFRSVTADIPLSIRVTKEEFQDGIKKKTLPTGVAYVCEVADTEEANRLAYAAKAYRR